jgi:hypothetical protein
MAGSGGGISRGLNGSRSAGAKWAWVADYVRYAETPRPAAATTHGKFYTVHLQDASPEDRETIERHLGLSFHFDGKGVAWQPIQSIEAAA